MLSQLPQPKIKDPNHTLIGIIVILVLIVGVTGGYFLFSHSQTPVITSNTSNNTTANNTTSPVGNQSIVEKKDTNSQKSNQHKSKSKN
jgi:flagellar basal body-associated protein FliL